MQKINLKIKVSKWGKKILFLDTNFLSHSKNAMQEISSSFLFSSVILKHFKLKLEKNLYTTKHFLIVLSEALTRESCVSIQL